MRNSGVWNILTKYPSPEFFLAVPWKTDGRRLAFSGGFRPTPRMNRSRGRRPELPKLRSVIEKITWRSHAMPTVGEQNPPPRKSKYQQTMAAHGFRVVQDFVHPQSYTVVDPRTTVARRIAGAATFMLPKQNANSRVWNRVSAATQAISRAGNTAEALCQSTLTCSSMKVLAESPLSVRSKLKKIVTMNPNFRVFTMR